MAQSASSTFTLRILLSEKTAPSIDESFKHGENMTRFLGSLIGFCFLTVLLACGSAPEAPSAFRNSSFSDEPPAARSSRKSFAEWCRTPNLAEASNLMVRSVLKTVQTNDCDLADSRARSLSDLRVSFTFQPLDLAPIESLTQLKKLDASSAGSLMKLEVLAAFTSLEDLDLSTSHLQSVEAISKISSLRRLDLGYNQITTVAPLSELKKLYCLGLKGNRLPHPQACPVSPNVCEF